MSRSRRFLPVWALLLLVAAAIAWQALRVSEVVAPEREAPAATAPAPVAPEAKVAPREGDRRDLTIDEQRGGHTLARHVGRTDDQLRDRLDLERNISAASTYTDRTIAERTVARALKQNAKRLEAWIAREGDRPNLAIDYRGSPGEVVGRSVARGRESSVTCTDALVVLRWTGRDYYVLTSYPETRR